MTLEEKSKLDYWLAVNIMGYAPTEDPDDFTETAQTLVWMRPGRPESEFPRPFYGESYFVRSAEKHSHTWRFYNPSENAVLAMQVLGEILKDGVVLTEMLESNGLFNIVGSRPSELIYGVNETGETISLAICLFAKKIYVKQSCRLNKNI